MLKPVKTRALAVQRAAEDGFAIVASEYNDRYVNGMLRAARAELKRAGARHVQVLRVPGAYEIPLIAAHLARRNSPLAADETDSSGAAPANPRISAIICLGVILRGETVHAAHIGEAISRALMDIQLRFEVPVVHEVLLLENEAQARARCLDSGHNRGAEAAQTALRMAAVMRGL